MPRTRLMRNVALLGLALLVTGCASGALRLRRVILYQNGVGYFERSGATTGGPVRLRLGAHEVDDVLTTLTVIDETHPADAPAPSAVLPSESVEEGQSQLLEVALGGANREVMLAYSVPTAAWRASYRLVLPDARGSDEAWLQAWAVVDNTSAEDWEGVELTLATDAPLSFAVDLRTPRMVERPNVTGHRVPAIAFGAVRSERTTRFGQDEALEAGGDRDADGIPDLDDLCPDEGEAYNGMEDEDGCPDRASVHISESRIEILDTIYFAADSIAVPASSTPILDALGATLRANPQIVRVEVQGHAARDEDSSFRIAAERAAVVRQALVARGVAADRLVTRAYGATRGAALRSERNRRVSFHIEEHIEERSSAPEGAADARASLRRDSLARSAGPTELPRVSSSGTRFPVARHVSIPAGRSAMVTILHEAVSGEDVLLYRVDSNVPATAHHPYRAARFVNRSGIDLIPGPVSLFARGELVGEGLLDTLRAGENAFVPYAVDTSTHIVAEVETEERPAAIASFHDGVLGVRRTRHRRTTYLVETGSRVAARLFLRHPRAPGYSPAELPPDTETSPEALLVPIPVEPDTDSALTVEERRTVSATIDLTRDLRTDLDPYLDNSDLDPAVSARLRGLGQARAALLQIHEEAALLDRQLAETADRSAELRQSVEALDERAGRSSSSIRRRLAERLEAAVLHSENVASRLVALRAREIDARAALRDAARDFAF